jgi:predicted transposase/invertase (TIGR01784 family)
MAENINDKGYRRMLSDKRNFLEFVRNRIAAPWTERLDADCLERLDARFVTKDFRDRESDIIYKAKIGDDDAIFYLLLELQSETDFTMPFRLLVYMTELLRLLFAEADENARERRTFRLPAVIPMVLYNGADEWNSMRSFKEYLRGYELFVPNVIDFTYILININEPDEAELLKTPTLVNLAMFADRKGKPERVLGRLVKVLALSKHLTADEKLQLKDWLFDVILRKIEGKADADAIKCVKKAFEREEEQEMTYAIERAIDEIERRGERRGERKGKLETAIAMINDGLSLETASKYSGIPADELCRSMENRKPE